MKKRITRKMRRERSEEDISIDNNVSPNTVKRVMDSYYDCVILYKNHLPKVLFLIILYLLMMRMVR